MLVRAGVPLPRALESLGRQAPSPALEALAGRLADAVRASLGAQVEDASTQALFVRAGQLYLQFFTEKGRASTRAGTLAAVLTFLLH